MSDDTFKKEKRYLFITLVSFSFSYLVDVSRNAIVYSLISNSKHNLEETIHNDLHDYICKNNFRLSIGNFITWSVTELTPYLIIFCLNLGNFRRQKFVDDYIQNRVDSRGSPTITSKKVVGTDEVEPSTLESSGYSTMLLLKPTVSVTD